MVGTQKYSDEEVNFILREKGKGERTEDIWQACQEKWPEAREWHFNGIRYVCTSYKDNPRYAKAAKALKSGKVSKKPKPKKKLTKTNYSDDEEDDFVDEYKSESDDEDEPKYRPSKKHSSATFDEDEYVSMEASVSPPHVSGSLNNTTRSANAKRRQASTSPYQRPTYDDQAEDGARMVKRARKYSPGINDGDRQPTYGGKTLLGSGPTPRKARTASTQPMQISASHYETNETSGPRTTARYRNGSSSAGMSNVTSGQSRTSPRLMTPDATKSHRIPKQPSNSEGNHGTGDDEHMSQDLDLWEFQPIDQTSPKSSYFEPGISQFTPSNSTLQPTVENEYGTSQSQEQAGGFVGYGGIEAQATTMAAASQFNTPQPQPQQNLMDLSTANFGIWLNGQFLPITHLYTSASSAPAQSNWAVNTFNHQHLPDNSLINNSIPYGQSTLPSYSVSKSTPDATLLSNHSQDGSYLLPNNTIGSFPRNEVSHGGDGAGMDVDTINDLDPQFTDTFDLSTTRSATPESDFMESFLDEENLPRVFRDSPDEDISPVAHIDQLTPHVIERYPSILQDQSSPDLVPRPDAAGRPEKLQLQNLTRLQKFRPGNLSTILSHNFSRAAQTVEELLVYETRFQPLENGSQPIILSDVPIAAYSEYEYARSIHELTMHQLDERQLETIDFIHRGKPNSFGGRLKSIFFFQNTKAIERRHQQENDDQPEGSWPIHDDYSLPDPHRRYVDPQRADGIQAEVNQFRENGQRTMIFSVKSDRMHGVVRGLEEPRQDPQKKRYQELQKRLLEDDAPFLKYLDWDKEPDYGPNGPPWSPIRRVG